MRASLQTPKEHKAPKGAFLFPMKELPGSLCDFGKSQGTQRNLSALMLPVFHPFSLLQDCRSITIANMHNSKAA